MRTSLPTSHSYKRIHDNGDDEDDDGDGVGHDAGGGDDAVDEGGSVGTGCEGRYGSPII